MKNSTNTEDLDERHEVVERIDKKDLQSPYDTNHEHRYERDPDETNDYYAEMCVEKNCNVGRLVAKN